MIEKKTYDLPAGTPVITEPLNGCLERFTVTTMEQIYLEIYLREDGHDFLIYNGFITDNIMLPLRIVPVNQDGNALPYTAEELVMNGPLIFFMKARKNAVARISVHYTP